jgi:hypothetical protein
MRYSTRRTMMRTGQILQVRAVDAAILTMAMIMTSARVRRICRVLRNQLGKETVQRIGWAKGRGRPWGKRRGRQAVKRTVLLNKPNVEMISLVSLL